MATATPRPSSNRSSPPPPTSTRLTRGRPNADCEPAWPAWRRAVRSGQWWLARRQHATVTPLRVVPSWPMDWPTTGRSITVISRTGSRGSVAVVAVGRLAATVRAGSGKRGRSGAAWASAASGLSAGFAGGAGQRCASVGGGGVEQARTQRVSDGLSALSASGFADDEQFSGVAGRRFQGPGQE